jgi:uncharacterized delta-60 repeat protein
MRYDGRNSYPARQSAIDGDGRLVVAGRDIDGRAVATRTLAAGQLDETFNGIGVLGVAIPRGVAIQADGKIIVSSLVDDDQVGTHVQRLHLDGTLDESFGDRGTTTVFGLDANLGIELDADGRILIAGDFLNTETHGVARLTADGVVDEEFGTDGVVTIGGSARLTGGAGPFAIASDGTIFLGTARVEPPGALIVELRRDGRDQMTYTRNPRGSTRPFWDCLWVQPDGKLVAVGQTGFDDSADLVVARFVP